MFVVVIPPRFETDLRAGRHPDIQLNIDATAMQQAAIGAGYIKNIVNARISSFFRRTDASARRPDQSGRSPAVQSERRNLLVCERRGHHQSGHSADGHSDGSRGDSRTRARDAGAPPRHAAHRIRDCDGKGLGQQSGDSRRDGAVALSGGDERSCRCRSPGRSRCGSRASCSISFSRRRLGLFLGTISRSMAQFALLIILVILVLQLLSGGSTPVESQPIWLQYMTFFLPSRHFVSFSQKIIYRGGGISAVWPQFLMVSGDRPCVLRVQLGAVPEIDRSDENSHAQLDFERAALEFPESRHIDVYLDQREFVLFRLRIHVAFTAAFSSSLCLWLTWSACLLESAWRRTPNLMRCRRHAKRLLCNRSIANAGLLGLVLSVSGCAVGPDFDDARSQSPKQLD